MSTDLRAQILALPRCEQDRDEELDLVHRADVLAILSTAEKPQTTASDIERWSKMLDYAQQHHNTSAEAALTFLRRELSAIPVIPPALRGRRTRRL